MRPRRPFDVRLYLIVLIALLQLLVACSKPAPQPAQAAAATPEPVAASAPPAEAVAKSTPCDLISDDELRAVFAGAITSKPEEHDAFGISACEWNGEFGRLLVQQWASKGHTPQDEVRDLVKGFIDTSRPGAAQRVRMVSLQGLGNYATAVVEARDLPAGVLSDVSVLSIARNGQTLVFLTDALDEQNRDEALAKLSKLGHYAYARL
ncbi:Protein of unknown function [Pseudoxanthomonas sp. GM95]|uniref:DUF3558 family protein n=1 Tax=Pseudoxanthomonas sp. GM95 TaxID=1881043 RepID=UPI0008BECD8D|nr:DUF3558 family protein [Pseudoxanthomonas sp. GM95]SEM20939.1 Protein of unknown function [Pseudoxanthomonas sp. GM95]